MTDAHQARWQRLFNALRTDDLATARQQLEILARDAPADPRQHDARALLAARRGAYRDTVRHLARATGATLAEPGAGTERHSTTASTIRERPDAYTLRALTPAARRETLIAATEISDADWTNLSLSGLAFQSVTCRRLRLGTSPSAGSIWDQSSWHGADASRGELAASQWYSSLWAGVVANGARLTGTRWHGHTFNTCQLMNANFSGAIVSNSRFVNCELLGCRFTGAILMQTRIGHGDGLTPLGQVDFSGAWLIDCDLTAADLTGATFTGATLVRTAVDPAYAHLLTSARLIG
jgi:uncharacterized protein YjbI with pentapeptide repeats